MRVLHENCYVQYIPHTLRMLVQQGQRMSDPSENSDNDPHLDHFCSFAATGATDAFQAIFVCRTCCADAAAGDEDNNPHHGGGDDKNQQRCYCICQACADHCHTDHDVDYVGMGPCYCDCREIGCSIAAPSQTEADRLGLRVRSSSSSSKAATAGAHCNSETDGPYSSLYVRDVFQVPLLLQDLNCTRRLRAQAQELVKHSRETFWLGADVVLLNDNGEEEAKDTSKQLCELEQLAVVIFRQHWQHYNLSDLKKGSDNDGEPTKAHPSKDRSIGAEWWVQVKHIRGEEQDNDYCAAAAEAVDLHYDKDEALAESFGLGAFPTLSTVTYLTTATNATCSDLTVEAAPTVIFNQRYDETETDRISEMMVSHPASHKHLVFDGRLLHGAPSHFALRRQQQQQPQTKLRSLGPSSTFKEKSDNRDQIRITFLVNVWIDHKPAAVETLPDSIRQALIQLATGEAAESSDPSLLQQFTNALKQQSPLFVGPLPVPKMTLGSSTAENESSADRIELPFVGGKATWANGDGDDDESDSAVMVLNTFPPPMHESDTLLVQFQFGFEAALQYSDGSSE